MVASSAICDLLYQLGISANYKGNLLSITLSFEGEKYENK